MGQERVVDESRFEKNAGGGVGVLIVDDDADSREALSELLRLGGWDVMTAETGEEAMRLARSRHPRLILLDVTLPGMSGIDVAHALRAQEDTHATGLIALTGRPLGERERGPFDAVLTKPTALDPLLSAMTHLLGGQESAPL